MAIYGMFLRGDGFFNHVSPSMGIYMDFSEDFIETSGDFPLCHGKIHHFTIGQWASSSRARIEVNQRHKLMGK
jgi:hypothetical protein